MKRACDLIAHWAREDGGARALSDTTGSLTYAQLDAATDAAASVLAGRGVGAADRVLLVAENDVAAVVLLLATQRLGAWPALVNPRVGATEVAAMRRRLEPRIVLYSTQSSPAAEVLAEAARARPIEVTLTGVRGSVPEALPASGSVTQADVGLLLFTSGTTGTPKAVMLSHDGLVELGRVLAGSRHTRHGDVVQGTAPLSHIMGVANLMAALHAGASLVLVPRLELPALVAAIAAGEITHLSVVPALYARLCEYIETHGIDLSSHALKYVSAGGAPLDGALKSRVERLLGLRLVNGYGMTECAPGCRTRPDRESPPGCIGWPEEGVEARIVVAGGERGSGARAESVTVDDAKAGEPGELWLRSPTQMLGYFGDDAATAAALRPGGWLATGDLARWLTDGSIEIVGRRKEMIIRSGFNVYPAEVEAALNALDGVLQSAVVGRPAANGDEDVVAFVQPRGTAACEPEALRQALRARLAPYKIPSRIVLLDALPLGTTGKIQKTRLVELLQEDK